MTKAIASEFLKIMACPKCKSHVIQDGDAIQCTGKECRLRYPIREGIPIMLVEEAHPHPE